MINRLRILSPKHEKQTAILLALIVHIVFLAVLIYGIRWQTHTQNTVEVSIVSDILPTVAHPRAPSLPPKVKAARQQPPPPPPEHPKPPVIPLAHPASKAPPLPRPLPRPLPVVKEKEQVSKRDPFWQKALTDQETQLTQQKAEQELKALKTAQAASQTTATIAKEQAGWIEKIRAKVRGNIIVPSNIQGNPEGIFKLTLLPTGEILSTKLEKTTGYPTLDAALERAILKSSPFPLPEKNEVFRRDLALKLRPLED